MRRSAAPENPDAADARRRVRNDARGGRAGEAASAHRVRDEHAAQRHAPAGALVVAQVLAPHGVRGELKCRLVTDFPERFQKGVRVLVGEPPTPRRVVAARVSGKTVYLRLSGVPTRDAAEPLRGSDVLVTREDAVPLPPGQYFWSDVIGLRAEDRSGQDLGQVTEILATGANDVYVVQGPAGEVLVPAIKDVVLAIEPARGRIVVDLPPGLEPREPRRVGRRRVAGP